MSSSSNKSLNPVVTGLPATQANDQQSENSSPLISVVICTYNRKDSLMATLEALTRMSVPPELTWELLVIDNNSSDGTKEAVGSFMCSERNLPLKYLFEPVAGLSHARNHGVQASQGTIIAFIDDDVIVSREWLAEVRNAFRQYDPVCVGGRVLLDETSPRPIWWDKAYDRPVGKFDRGTSVITYKENDEYLIGIGANMMFKKIVFEKYGLFRTDMGKRPDQLNTGEEADMVRRLGKHKELIIYYPKAVLYHCPAAERFTKRYLREHFYSLGWCAFLRELDGPDTSRILGVARWRFRSVLGNIYKMVVLWLRGRRTESFVQQLQFAHFVGYFRAAQSAKRRALSTNRSPAS